MLARASETHVLTQDELDRARGDMTPELYAQEFECSFEAAIHGAYAANQNTYAALYNGVLQRDWFHARARGYASTLDAALHGNNIPTSVVENLIASTREGVEPLRRYHRL